MRLRINYGAGIALKTKQRHEPPADDRRAEGEARCACWKGTQSLRSRQDPQRRPKVTRESHQAGPAKEYSGYGFFFTGTANGSQSEFLRTIGAAFVGSAAPAASITR